MNGTTDNHSKDFAHVLTYALYGTATTRPVCEECAALRVTLDGLAEEYIFKGSIRDRFYHLAILNRPYDQISREILSKRIDILTAGYTDLFDEHSPFDSRNVHVCRFFFESATRIGPFRDRLMEYCVNLGNSPNLSTEDKQHLVDVLPRCELKDRVMKTLRNTTLQTLPPRRDGGVLYFEDNQSVHFVKTLTATGEDLPDRSAEFETFVAELPDDMKTMKAIEAIRISNSSYNICSTFVHVLAAIKKLPAAYTSEVMNRLKEELTDMTDVCATGMNARLINVLTGYTDSIRVTLPFEAELRGAFFTRFNKKLSEASETLRDMYVSGITEREKTAEYVIFKETTKAELYSELKKEYESMPGYDELLFKSAFAEACHQV